MPNRRTGVTASAPLSMSDEAIECFVRTRITWIKLQIAKYDNQPRQSKREYASVYIFGESHITFVIWL